jgi:phosphoribosylformylglycinamidine (FGAM) synthase-like enzyme
VVVSVAPDDAEAVRQRAEAAGARATPVGTVTDGPLRVSVGATPVLEVAVDALRRPYETAIPEAMGEAVAAE